MHSLKPQKAVKIECLVEILYGYLLLDFLQTVIKAGWFDLIGISLSVVTQFGRCGHGLNWPSISSPVDGVMAQVIRFESEGCEKSVGRIDIDNHHSLLNFFNGCLHSAAGNSSIFIFD